MKTKICSKCKKEKSLIEFHKDRTSFDGYGYWCKPCKNEYQKTPKARKVQKRNHERRYKTHGWSDNINKNYGKGAADWYKQKIKKQHYCCAICGKSQSEFKKRLDLDHNHKTGKWRGILCLNCNTALGQLKVDECGTELLEKAIKYLKESKSGC